MPKDVIIALDFPDREKTLAFLDRFDEEKPFVKIGMELYYAEGPDIVREIKRRGHRIFLDLKLHDIPNTVMKAMRVLSSLDVDMTNLHAAGTIAMMEAAKEGLTRPDGTCPVLLAVTQLTSTSEERMRSELLINASMPDTVRRYALNAKAAGRPGDLYYGAPTLIFVLAPDDGFGVLDACAVETNMLNAAYACGLGSCWIHRANQMFKTEEGKAYLRKWGLDESLDGWCSIALGYADMEPAPPKPRKEGYYRIIK